MSQQRLSNTVLAKLRWSAMSGGSQRQFNDALHVCELQWDILDRDYLRKWSQTLGVEEGWQLIVASVETE